MKRRLLALAGTLFTTTALAAAAAAPAGAITGGEPDNGRHPNVGMVVFYQGGSRFRCSGTLVTPTVVITAAHCTFGDAPGVVVTFNENIAEQPPSGLPVAADPSVGYRPGEVPASYHRGEPFTHPEYSDFTDLDNWNDVGVVVLDSPVTGITPATLAPENYLDGFAQPALNHTLFDIVGYGTEVRKPDSGPQKPTPMSFPLLRRFTQAPGQKLTPQILQVNGNEHDVRGGGGSCFGDSGGPAFLNGNLVTVTSYGYTLNCRYLDGLQRVDIPGVQAWLTGFGVTS